MWMKSRKTWERGSQTVSPSPWKHEGWGQRWGRSWVPSSQRTTGCRRHGAASGTHGTKASLGPDYPHRLGLPLGWMLAAGDALGPGRSGHDRATGPEPEGCRPPHRSTARMPSGSAEPLLPAAPQTSWVPDRAPGQGRRHLQTWPFLSPSPALPTWGAQLRIPSTSRKRLHCHLFLSRLSSCRRPPHPRHRRTPGLGLCCPLRQGEGSVRAEGALTLTLPLRVAQRGAGHTAGTSRGTGTFSALKPTKHGHPRAGFPGVEGARPWVPAVSKHVRPLLCCIPETQKEPTAYNDTQQK